MVDLKGQYLSIQQEIDQAINNVLSDSAFIKGKYVSAFEQQLAEFLDVKHVIGVGNGTDAIQIALMALGIGPGDEVIAPSFTFVATAESAALLGATPVFADVDADTFNISPQAIEELITPATKAIVPVHLYGQSADMTEIVELARKYNLRVIEDGAQSIGAQYKNRSAGTLGDMGTLSFFPSKNLGCYGDGGAIITNDDHLADSCRLIASHGSKKKYMNEVIGVNSRLDGLQAAVLGVKLRYLSSYNERRNTAADSYDLGFSECPHISTPVRAADRSHVFHQYTIRIHDDDRPDGDEAISRRDRVSASLGAAEIPHAVYYPVPVHRLPVYASGRSICRYGRMTNTEILVDEVLSLPMHTELSPAQLERITSAVLDGVMSKQT